MVRLRTVAAIAVALPAVHLLYNFDAYTGQWKFNDLCAKTAGTRHFGPIERNAGWWVDGHSRANYQLPFEFGDLAFVRFVDDNGRLTDVRRESSHLGDTKYSLHSSGPKEPKYKLSVRVSRFKDDPRFSETRYEVVDVASGATLASHIAIKYEWTKPDRVLLGAPTLVQCHAGADVDKFFASIYSNTGGKQ